MPSLQDKIENKIANNFRLHQILDFFCHINEVPILLNLMMIQAVSDLTSQQKLQMQNLISSTSPDIIDEHKNIVNNLKSLMLIVDKGEIYQSDDQISNLIECIKTSFDKL